MRRVHHRGILRTSLLGALVAGGLWLARPGQGQPGERPATISSRVVTWDDAELRRADWGEMRTFFRGETFGTTHALAATMVVEPGESVHPAHRHAEEEYLVLIEGSGRWHLDGKDFPAKTGDVLHVAPWAWHGLVNTGDEPLTFFVVRWKSKGVDSPPAPPGDHGR